MDFPFYPSDSVNSIFATEFYYYYVILLFISEPMTASLTVFLLLLTFCCLSVTAVVIPTSGEKCKQKDAVNNCFSGQSGKMKAARTLRLKQGSNSSGNATLSLNCFWKHRGGNSPVWNCAMENTMCHFVANCTYSGARQRPYQHTFMHTHHTMPFISALCFFAVHQQLLCNHTLGCSLISLQCWDDWGRQDQAYQLCDWKMVIGDKNIKEDTLVVAVAVSLKSGW